MRKKLLALVLCCVAAALFTVGGLSAGARLEYARAVEEESFRQGQSTAIAVMSMDAGAQYKGEHIVFAEEIIASLPAAYVLVSREIGEAGLAQGAFGALLSFPVDFSVSLSTVNTIRPVSASFTYRVNPNLPEEERIEIMREILMLEREINDRMSYMFVSSVFGELHEAQDRVSAVLDNDAANLEAIHRVEEMELNTRLTLSYLMQEAPQFQGVDPSAQMSDSQALFTQMNEKYKEYLQLAAQEAKAIAQEAERVVNDQSTGVSAFAGTIQNTVWLPEGAQEPFDAISDESEALAAGLVSSLSQADHLQGELLTLLEAFADQIELEGEDALEAGEFLEQYDLSGMEQVLANRANQSVSAYETALNAAIEGERQKVAAHEQAAKAALTAEFDKKLDQVREVTTKRLASYNPLYHIQENQQEFTGYSTRYSTNMSQIQGLISEYVTHTNGEVNQLYQNHLAYIDTLREDIRLNKEEADGVVNEAIGILLETKRATSASNREHMAEFAGKLPYSRLGGLGNNNVYNFIASPVQGVHANPLAQPTPPEVVRQIEFLHGDAILYLIGGCALFIIVWIAVFAIALGMQEARGRMRREEELQIIPQGG